MEGGDYKFNLLTKTTREYILRKQTELIKQLNELGVRVNKPHEMRIEQLESLVNHHRKTVEARKTVVSDEQMKTAKSNGLTRQDVIDRVDDLNWDLDDAVRVKKVETKERQRERRKRERMLMIQKLNEMELQGKKEAAN